MTALVLSAGGMYGAYQAGAWKALASRIRPDLAVGTSVGALNAWVIAGRAAPEELISLWLDPDSRRLSTLRLLQAPWKGFLDSRLLHARIRKLYEAYRPAIPVAVTATDLLRLRTRVFTTGEITWRHLAASCAVPLGYEQIRIEGRIYTDGGLLEALPLDAAAGLGATRIVAVNALPEMPSLVVRTLVRGVRALAARHAKAPPLARHVAITIVQPPRALGPLRKAVCWDRNAVREWIERGEADALRVALE